ncbi:MAG: hypothetical protein COX07_05770, partial [Bacteroidetes bacterium CG23_combo_of_CG06-09_8_20_14_all_32_9]
LEMQFAGANNPLYIIHGSNLKISEQENIEYFKNNQNFKVLNELIEIKPDKMPVAIYEHLNNFTNNEYKTQKGDCIYLCSDGYEDQFGGSKNKKFMVKQLKKLLVNIANKPMNEQHEILNTTFENWRGDNAQVDDVTILGLKI